MLAYREWRLRILARDLRPVLQSTYVPTLWLEPTLTADRLPEVDGDVAVTEVAVPADADADGDQGQGQNQGQGQGQALVTVAPPPPFPAMGLGSRPYRYGELHGIHAVVPGHGHHLLTPHSLSLLRVVRVLGAVDCFGRVVEHTDGVVRAEHARVLAVRVVWPDHRCPDRCRAYVVVKPTRSYWNDPTPPPGPVEEFYVLRKPCGVGVGCGRLRADTVRVFDPWGVEVEREERPWEVVAETTADELERLLRERYEVPALPHGEGPWRWL